jgi:hypothetical protein
LSVVGIIGCNITELTVEPFSPESLLVMLVIGSTLGGNCIILEARKSAGFSGGI